MRFHLLGLSHTQTTREYSACAFTQKIRLFAKMMTARGHEVIHYGVEGSDPICSENVTVLLEESWAKVHRKYDWRIAGFTVNRENPAYRWFTKNAIDEVRRRARPGDFLLCPFGLDHKPVADAAAATVPGLIVVEPGIGYDHTFAPHRVFESYSWMHLMYGRESRALHPPFYDAVIPNYYDLNDYQVAPAHEDFFLFVGRPTPLKGARVASDVCSAIGAKLYTAGQGAPEPGVESEHLGALSIEERAKWMGRARALFVPTRYVEPFGSVAIEAALCGTPVITTDFGAFTETVIHGQTGYRCRTFEQFVWAARNIDRISSTVCRGYAAAKYSLERVGEMYEEYFQMLADLHSNGRGWYSLARDRREMGWLDAQ